MAGLLAKISFSLAYLLSALSGFDYISIPTHEIIFDYSTGQNSPIHGYINLKNIGPQVARFDLSSDQSWLKFYREGNELGQSLEIDPQAAINVVVEVDPRRLDNGEYNAIAKITASKPFYSDLYDTETVSVILRKNYVPLVKKSTPEATKIPSTTPEQSLRPLPSMKSSVTPSPSLAAKPSKSNKFISATPTIKEKPPKQESPERPFWYFLIKLFN